MGHHRSGWFLNSGSVDWVYLVEMENGTKRLAVRITYLLTRNNGVDDNDTTTMMIMTMMIPVRITYLLI